MATTKPTKLLRTYRVIAIRRIRPWPMARRTTQDRHIFFVGLQIVHLRYSSFRPCMARVVEDVNYTYVSRKRSLYLLFVVVSTGDRTVNRSDPTHGGNWKRVKNCTHPVQNPLTVNTFHTPVAFCSITSLIGTVLLFERCPTAPIPMKSCRMTPKF